MQKRWLGFSVTLIFVIIFISSLTVCTDNTATQNRQATAFLDSCYSSGVDKDYVGGCLTMLGEKAARNLITCFGDPPPPSCPPHSFKMVLNKILDEYEPLENLDITFTAPERLIDENHTVQMSYRIDANKTSSTFSVTVKKVIK